MLSNGLLALLLLAVATYLHSKLSWKRRSKTCPLPPTPKPRRPFIGLSQEMVDDSWGKPWQKQTNIVVASAAVAQELLEKRGANYSGRLPSPFIAELVNRDMILANSNDPKRVKRLRRLLHEQFSQVGSQVFQDMQRDEAVLLLDHLLGKPTASDQAFTDSKHRLVMRFCYGGTSTVPMADLWAFVKRTETRAIPPTAPLFTPFPWLARWPAWLPGGGFHRLAEEYHQEDRMIWERVRDDVKSSLESGKISPDSCLLARMYASKAPSRLGFSDLEMAFVAANLFIAGGDLPEITLRIFTLVMLYAPEAMKKAQAELDAVVGRERMPGFEDKAALPYTRALILETQRWRPLSGIGVAHTNFADDWIDGFFIPKGSVIFPDLHAMSRDPTIYPEPELFKPERFLHADGSLNKRHEIATFGYGHRICSARFFGEATVFLNVACLLWAFDIKPQVDASGKAILPDSNMDNWKGVNPCQPLPFEAVFTPRQAGVAQVVAAAKEALSAA